MNPTLKRIGILLLVGAVAAGVANGLHPRKIPWMQDWSRHVEAKAAKQNIKVIPLSIALEKFKASNTAFIDARSTVEFSNGHIRGAVSIPFQSFEEHFSELIELMDSNQELIFYCTHRECDDALLLATEVQALGCSNLVLYVDGFELWEKHGGAVEAGK